MDIRTKIRQVFSEECHYFTEQEFWGTVAAGILPFAKDTKRFLLSLRSMEVMEPGTWGTIGGKLDEGEDDPKQTAIREMDEEIGVSVNYDDLILVYTYKTKELDDNGDPKFRYFTYASFVDNENTELENKSFGRETERVKWLSLQEIKKLPNLHYGVKELLNKGILAKIAGQ